MRPSDLLPAPGTAAGRFVALPGSEAAPDVEVAAEGWSRIDVAAATGDDHLLVAAIGDDGAVAGVLPGLTSGTPSAVVVLATGAPEDAAVERALVRIAAHGWWVDRVEPLDDAVWRTGAVLTPASAASAEASAGLARRARALLQERRAGDDVEATRAADVLQRRLHAAEAARASEFTRAGVLERDLERTRHELAVERHRVQQLERSTSYRLGEAVVQTVRDPRQLPRRSRELLDRWRKRGDGGAGSADRPGAAPGPLEPSRRFPMVTSVPSLAAPQRRDAVAAVVTDRTADALADDVLLTRLLPFDAIELIALTTPQVVLIESGACAAGQPWTGAGVGAVPARDRELAAIVDAAARVGAASVLIWSGPRWRTPGLAAIAARCDLEVGGEGSEVDWVLGAPPRRLGISPERRADLALFDPDGTVRPPAGFDGRLTTFRADVGSLAATDPWAVWGRHTGWLVPATGPDRWQVAAAAGAGATPVVRDRTDVPAWARAFGAVSVAEADPLRPPSWGERRRAVLDGGCAATLRTLGGAIGRDLVPDAARSVALHLAAADERHVDAVLALDHLPPGSVVVTATALPDRAVAALEVGGIRARRYAPADARFDVTLDAARHGRGHVADLLAGWELTRRPVVATAAVDDVQAGVLTDSDERDRLLEREAQGPAGGTPDTGVTLVPAGGGTS